ncbi:MAG: hypothetical protein GXP29_13800 [Planctomycetes bacterium]|nr:hypothetical protein [Planctomycetota bacterium]
MKNDAWAQAQGLRWHGFYMISTKSDNYMCTWRDACGSRILCTYVIANRTESDFVTAFDNGIDLTTVSNHDGHLSPYPPGSYVQAFDALSFDERWQRHTEAETYLERESGARRILKAEPFEKLFLKGLREKLTHIRSIPLWYLRSVHWCIFRRQRMGDLTIEQQHRQGLIDLTRTV